MSYTAVLAGEDLKCHMNEQAEGLGTNVWWRIEKRMEPVFWWAFGACILGAIIGTETYLHLPEPVHFAGYTAMAVGTVWVLADFVVVTFAKQPGTWKKYAVAEFAKKYPWPYALTVKYNEIRHWDRGSEFTIEVLERKDYAGPQGIVLWQWDLSRKTSLAEEATSRLFSVLILNAKNQVVEKMYEG